MSLIGGSKSSSNDNKRQTSVTSADDSSAVVVDASGKNSFVSITDGGAIQGNIAVANNALLTAKTITSNLADSFSESQKSALGSVEKLTRSFSGALESVKKAELTGGGSLLFDNLKYWPIIPVAMVAIALVRNRGKS